MARVFFAMTGENAANVAEETIDPSETSPRALIGGMVAAGVVYVLVAMSAALVVPVNTLAEADAALLEVVRRRLVVAALLVIGALVGNLDPAWTSSAAWRPLSARWCCSATSSTTTPVAVLGRRPAGARCRAVPRAAPHRRQALGCRSSRSARSCRSPTSSAASVPATRPA